MIKMKKLLLFVLLLVVFSSFVSADLGVFEVGESVQLLQVCDSCSFVTLNNVHLPDGSLSLIGVNMTMVGESFNYSFSDTSLSGVYLYSVCGDKGGVLACEVLSFEVVAGGVAGGDGWVAIVISLCCFAALLLLASSFIKDKHLASLKLFLFLIGVVNIFFVGLIPFVISLNPISPKSFLPVAITLFGVNVVLLFAFVFLYGTALLTRFFDFVLLMVNNRRVKKGFKKRSKKRGGR